MKTKKVGKDNPDIFALHKVAMAGLWILLVVPQVLKT